MTEEEWMAGIDPRPLVLEVARRKETRKLRLYSCGCCRQLLVWASDPLLGQALCKGEEYADARIADSTLNSWRLKVNRLERHLTGDASKPRSPDRLVAQTFSTICLDSRYGGYADAWITLFRHHATFGPEYAERMPRLAMELLRDIFGNPFRPVVFAPAWRSSAAVGVAQQMYDARDFAAMPILADALQDAGCEDGAILSHCRDPRQVHVRGCWVVDLVLDKS